MAGSVTLNWTDAQDADVLAVFGDKPTENILAFLEPIFFSRVEEAVVTAVRNAEAQKAGAIEASTRQAVQERWAKPIAIEEVK